MKEYLIEFPIGDWSNDGHGKCDYYIVNSNKPVEEVREVHFKIAKRTGIIIANICCQEKGISLDDPILKQFNELGYRLDEEGDESYIDDGMYYPSSKEIVRMWLFLLMKTDGTLRLEIVNIPMLPFYGYDDNFRHMETPGYGLFD